jgi:hypothetical protein
VLERFGTSKEKTIERTAARVLATGISMDTGTISRIAKTTEDEWAISMAFQKKIILKEQLLEIDRSQSKLPNVPAVVGMSPDEINEQ